MSKLRKLCQAAVLTSRKNFHPHENIWILISCYCKFIQQPQIGVVQYKQPLNMQELYKHSAFK